jgi:hypothetical protein
MYQVSKSPEEFLSQYQPGGTTTILCNNWISRVVARGEDPIGLGRWSFFTLCGKGHKKLTIITAYNASYSQGDTTNFRQQQRTLSHLHIHHSQHVTSQPRRQFILDLQSWLEELIAQHHEIILAMDANASYNPDTAYPTHPLSYRLNTPTLAPGHNGTLATLISTCGLVDPLARQHSSRPFPASHI